MYARFSVGFQLMLPVQCTMADSAKISSKIYCTIFGPIIDKNQFNSDQKQKDLLNLPYTNFIKKMIKFGNSDGKISGIIFGRFFEQIGHCAV